MRYVLQARRLLHHCAVRCNIHGMHSRNNPMSPRVGDQVIYWEMGPPDAWGHPVLTANAAMVAGTCIKGPPVHSADRSSEDPHDCMLFVMFSPGSQTGGGCGNRYVRAAMWHQMVDGGVCWPDVMRDDGPPDGP